MSIFSRSKDETTEATEPKKEPQYMVRFFFKSGASMWRTHKSREDCNESLKRAYTQLLDGKIFCEDEIMVSPLDPSHAYVGTMREDDE